jgi:hypothetical protein
MFSSAIPSAPWFIESAFGWLGILATAPLLLIIGRMMPQLKKSEGFCITRTRQVIPFIASIEVIINFKNDKKVLFIVVTATKK